jgi:hypothetical protein
MNADARGDGRRMIVDEELSRIAQDLERADSVDASRIELALDDGVVVLRGAVATPEQATAAAMVVERRVPDIRNELRVDENLRESGQETQPAPKPLGEPPYEGSDVAPPSSLDFGATDDIGEALDQNLSLQPPDDPVTVATRAEERGVVDHDVTAPEPEGRGDVERGDGERYSAEDLSQAELERSARHREEQ